MFKDEPLTRVNVMKNIIKSYKHTLAMFGIVLSFSAMSENNEQSTGNELKLAKEFLSVCVNDAKEDEVDENELIDYLAVCINDELEASDSKILSYAQIVELIKNSKLIKLPKV